MRWLRRLWHKSLTERRLDSELQFHVEQQAAKYIAGAYLWISAAALQGDTRGNALLLSLERQLTPAQLAQAKLRVRSLVSASGVSRNVASLP